VTLLPEESSLTPFASVSPSIFGADGISQSDSSCLSLK